MRVFLRAWWLTGLVAVVSAWITVFLSTYLNPWFNVFSHALSDLGSSRAYYPEVYNYGLMVTGVLACAFALYLALFSKTRTSVFASALFFVAGIFLALIGVYPSSTRPHVFVSSYFFAQAWLAVVAFTVDSYHTKHYSSAILLTCIAAGGPLGALLVKWPSVALLEIYGVALIDVFAVWLTLMYKPRHYLHREPRSS